MRGWRGWGGRVGRWGEGGWGGGDRRSGGESECERCCADRVSLKLAVPESPRRW